MMHCCIRPAPRAARCLCHTRLPSPHSPSSCTGRRDGAEIEMGRLRWTSTRTTHAGPTSNGMQKRGPPRRRRGEGLKRGAGQPRTRWASLACCRACAACRATRTSASTRASASRSTRTCGCTAAPSPARASWRVACRQTSAPRAARRRPARCCTCGRAVTTAALRRRTPLRGCAPQIRGVLHALCGAATAGGRGAAVRL